MTSKILRGAEEAIAFARGESPAARLTVNGHAYVPEASVSRDAARLIELLRAIVRHTTVVNRNMDQMVRDIDMANDYSRSALNILLTERQSLRD